MLSNLGSYRTLTSFRAHWARVPKPGMEVRSHHAVVMGLFSRRAEHLESTLPDNQGAVSFRAIRARFVSDIHLSGRVRFCSAQALYRSTAMARERERNATSTAIL